MYDVAVIGGGPAGLTAAVYARRAGKSVLVIEKAAFGGQITWSPKVENFPGVISASGNEIGDMLLSQAMEQGAEVELEEIVGAEQSEDGFRLKAESGAAFEARSVIIATGARPRMTGLAGEEELIGAGVCFCAVCDGAFYKGKTVAVCGGGNSALQDALLLSEKCEKVFLIHRRDAFRAEAKLVDALREKNNVEFILSAELTEFCGSGELSGVKYRRGGAEYELKLDGLFVAIGHMPQNDAFSSLMELDEKGYADSAEDCLTKTPGVFAAGDCRRKTVRQCATACADGAVAALAACSWLES